VCQWRGVLREVLGPNGQFIVNLISELEFVIGKQPPVPEEMEEKIFEVVNQLNRGADLIDSPEERVRVAELNLIAAKRAKTSTAYTSAQTYLPRPI